MKSIKLEIKHQGFDFTYYPCKESNKTLILMAIKKSTGRMIESSINFLQKRGFNVLVCITQNVVNADIECFGDAIEYLKKNDVKNIGIIGVSFTAIYALVASNYYQDINLTILISPCDILHNGLLEKYTNIYDPYLRFNGNRLDYLKYDIIKENLHYAKDSLESFRAVLDEIETKKIIKKSNIIGCNNMKGKLILISASDDEVWDSYKYVRRIELSKENNYNIDIEKWVYPYGTHILIPEGIIKDLIPLKTEKAIASYSKSLKFHKRECKSARVDIEKRFNELITNW